MSRFEAWQDKEFWQLIDWLPNIHPDLAASLKLTNNPKVENPFLM